MPSIPNLNVTRVLSSTALQSDLQAGVKSTSYFFTFITVIGVIIVIILVILIIKWIIREKRLRELRHRLIPLYTFDPNDEDDWEAELLSQDQSIFSSRSPQDYNSVGVKDDSTLSMNKRKLNSV